MPRRGHRIARLAQAHEGRFLNLRAIDRVRHRNAEVPILHQLAQLGIFLIGLIEHDHGVRAAEARPRDDVVILFLFILFQHRDSSSC